MTPTKERVRGWALKDKQGLTSGAGGKEKSPGQRKTWRPGSDRKGLCTPLGDGVRENSGAERATSARYHKLGLFGEQWGLERTGGLINSLSVYSEPIEARLKDLPLERLQREAVFYETVRAGGPPGSPLDSRGPAHL